MFKITEPVQPSNWRDIMDWKERDAIGDFHGDLDTKEPRMAPIQPDSDPAYVKQMRLVLAAPELLEACKLALKVAEEHCLWGTAGNLRVAIAKAEGK